MYTVIAQSVPSNGKFELVSLEPPSSGWEKLWLDIEESDILQLPDSSELRNGNLVNDGITYIFEILTEKGYRTFRYSSPENQKWDEAKIVLSFYKILRNEFVTIP